MYKCLIQIRFRENQTKLSAENRTSRTRVHKSGTTIAPNPSSFPPRTQHFLTPYPRPKTSITYRMISILKPASLNSTEIRNRATKMFATQRDVRARALVSAHVKLLPSNK